MTPALLLAIVAQAVDGYSPDVTHPYLAFSTVTRAELERDGRKRVRVVRRIEDQTETVGGVACRVMVEEEFVDGVLHEVARNFFAQKDGAVWYFGEDVDNYRKGRIDNHKGSWRVGREAKAPFLYMPAAPKKGDVFRPEDVAGVADDRAEVLETGGTLEVGGTTYADVLKVRYTKGSDDEVKVRSYAKGVGLIREEEGDTKLDLRKADRRPR
jgi:hypothetical protein